MYRMPKQLKIPIRSLGSEVEDPSISALSVWIATHRGIEADLITYKLEESIRVQKEVDIPAAGGRFYGSHLSSSLVGTEEGILVEEPAVDLRFVSEDTTRIITLRKGAWSSLPAPHLWEVKDRYFDNRDEFQTALCQCAVHLMRAMRDKGIAGHILLCDTMLEEELELLSGPKVVWYSEKPGVEDLSLLLERHRTIAVPSDHLSLVIELLSEFEVDHLIVVDPNAHALSQVQSHFDPEAILVGGYCKGKCSEYWSHLRESAHLIQ